MDAKKTGELIARRRKEQGLSQGELAERIHVTDKAVSKWETGRGMPGIDSLEPLAEVLGLSVSELLSGQRLTEEEKPKAAERQMMESMERERRTRRMSNLLTALTALIGIAAIGWGTWLAAHYLGSVPETDIAGLEQGAVAYLGTPREMLLGPFDYNALQIVEMERRGDYLAALCTDGQGNWCMCVTTGTACFQTAGASAAESPAWAPGSWAAGISAIPGRRSSSSAAGNCRRRRPIIPSRTAASPTPVPFGTVRCWMCSSCRTPATLVPIN